jgi:beta-lactamase class A
MNANLKKQLDDICRTQLFHVGYSYINLQTGDRVERFGAQVVPSASTRKVFVLACALKDINEGRFNLDDDFRIQEKYQSDNSGIFRYFTPNRGVITVHDALVGMIAISDNVCTGGLIELIGFDRLNTYIQTIGMENTSLQFGSVPSATSDLPVTLESSNVTTPDDAASTLQLLFNGRSDETEAKRIGLTAALCTLAIDILFMQQFTSRLPAHLPTEARVAHKGGTRSNVFNDIGIVYKENTPLFVLAVYTFNVPLMVGDMPGKYVASELIADVCLACYDFSTKEST